ncbi:MAG TPA: hypothetical protein VKA21_12330 [Candidatus Binatia bacterium]|nr:hypothetical protein [Candidatus Binatia bacterium]
MTSRTLGLLAAVLASIGVAAPAVAQFDPAFNHLKCYRIKGPRIDKVLLAENQFGRERIVKLVPLFLCAPTKKICCSNTADVPGCTPVACPADPTPNQPAAVDHFKCYKIGVRFCDQLSGAACTTLTKAPRTTQAFLQTQFGDETVTVGPAKMLCAPVLKTVLLPATTTTTIGTTTTTVPTFCCEWDTGFAPPLETACLDDVFPAVDTKCTLLGGTIKADRCHPGEEKCVTDPVIPPNDWCCECPVSTPPFPHSTFCFEGKSPHEAKCAMTDPACVLTTGTECDPVSETCVTVSP